MNLNRIEATVIPENKPSLRVLEKAGFVKEGLLREQKLLHGKFCDAYMYALLKRDFMKL
jgi:ribosomal-protein-alanine N-acetyltransferase